MRASYDHYSVPLCRRAVGRVLEIQTGAVGLVVRDRLAAHRRIYPRDISRAFNYLTPSGRVTVTGRVVEVTPNVTRQIVAIPVKPNVPVEKDDILFQVDPAPFRYKVTQLQASLAAAKQNAEILKSNYEQA